MLLAKLPIHLAINLLYVTIIYLNTGQPLEWHRMTMFFSVVLLIGMISESLGIIISARLSMVVSFSLLCYDSSGNKMQVFSIQNAMFVGPVLTVPMMLLAIYGIGNGPVEPPIYVRLLMSSSYLRYGMEGLIAAIYGYDRGRTECPDAEVYCAFSSADYLRQFMGFGEADFAVAMAGLAFYYVLFTVAAFFMVRMRISRTRSQYVAVQYVSQLVKKHLNFASY